MKHFESQVKIKRQDNEMNKLLVYRPLSLFFILFFSFNFSSCLPGYTCDVSGGTCVRGNTQSELAELSVGNVKCDDGSSCPTGTTCCKLSSGDWGCCPYPKAVCCDDGEHCCPQGLSL